MLPAHSWQLALAKSFHDPAAMLEALELRPGQPPDGLLSLPTADTTPFPFRVPRGYVARMQKGNPYDPLLRQVLPTAEEATQSPGYTHDPLDERGAWRAPGLLQKYHGRALLIATAACAIHCRYCFRRHFFHGDSFGDALGDASGAGSQASRPIRGNGLVPRHLDAALARIRRDDTLREVILSGGDPLCLSDERLAALAGELAAIPHLRRLRIHTRLPVVLPERVDDALLAWLTRTGLQTVIVIHANHPNEIDDRVARSLARFRTRGIAVLNQSVLLRGVNDHEDTLARLSERLFAAGVLPYYLHLPDPVAGTRHFAVETARAKEIATELNARLPGYLVPRPVREVAGERYKVPLYTSSG